MAKKVGGSSHTGGSQRLGKTYKSDALKRAEKKAKRVKGMRSKLKEKAAKMVSKRKDVRTRRSSVGPKGLKARFEAFKSQIVTRQGKNVTASNNKTYVKVEVAKNKLKVSSKPVKDSEKELLADKVTKLGNDIFNHKSAEGTLLSTHQQALEYVKLAIMQQVESMEDQQAARAFANGDLSFDQLYMDNNQHGSVLIHSESENGDLVSFQLEFNFVVRDQATRETIPEEPTLERETRSAEEKTYTAERPAKEIGRTPQTREAKEKQSITERPTKEIGRTPGKRTAIESHAKESFVKEKLSRESISKERKVRIAKEKTANIKEPKIIEGSSSSSKGKGKTESKTWAEVSFKGSLGPKIKDSELSANERETLISKLENSLKRSIFKSKAFDASDFKDNKGAQDLFINEVKEAILNIDDNVVKRGIAKADTGNIKVTDVHVNNRGKSGDLSIGVKIIGGQGNIDFNIEWNIVNPALRPKA